MAITGYRVPPPEMATIEKYGEMMIARIPYFDAWGVFTLIGDAAICGTSKLSSSPCHDEANHSDLLPLSNQRQYHAQAKEIDFQTSKFGPGNYVS